VYDETSKFNFISQEELDQLDQQQVQGMESDDEKQILAEDQQAQANTEIEDKTLTGKEMESTAPVRDAQQTTSQLEPTSVDQAQVLEVEERAMNDIQQASVPNSDGDIEAPDSEYDSEFAIQTILEDEELDLGHGQIGEDDDV
jgi:hypothetical protein